MASIPYVQHSVLNFQLRGTLYILVHVGSCPEHATRWRKHTAKITALQVTL